MDSSAPPKSDDNAQSTVHHEVVDTESTIKPPVGGDVAAQLIAGQQIVVTEEDNKRICRKTDKHILTILVWVYFLQILDKSVLGYGAIFGLRDDCNLVGSQYSAVGSMSAIAQLVWLPFSSWLIVKVPHRILMPILIFGWGTAQTCMAACNGFASLMATRFFLGLFEAACLPLFSVITSQWYRRAEQPMRVACWYSTNGFANMFAAALSFGLEQINGTLPSWRILFLFVGLITVITAPVVWWFMDNDIATARFLTEEERLMGIERLRANQTGTGSRKFKWSQALEALLEIKTWLFIAMGLTLNVSAMVTNIFGPLIIGGFGFAPGPTALLNIPFGAVQVLIILPASYLAYRFRIKSVFLAVIMLPVLAGTIMLYLLPRDNIAPLFAAYYMLAFLFGGNPLIVSWMIPNIGGATKKSVILSLFNIGVSAGNIIGPLLFSTDDAPEYRPGLEKTMGITCALLASIGLQVINIYYLNKMQERKRVRNGKPAKIHDLSMEHRYENRVMEEDGEQLGQNAFMDLTDSKNDEFVYLY
ncbi:major facilitator superfamily domain-containing protein [Stachybotrys elegans]|uniref:Major facilitator superfamily domain-containing protein n=1 Tax=Stachybotrys elegans TaxID=80388 RepID=A0A8K0WQ75_9HYPO|nr:major facilitator superfamily domain-containing protein [Stachybotrys elegans]